MTTATNRTPPGGRTPDPNNPKPGDRFFDGYCWFTVLYVGKQRALVETDTGEEAAWTLAFIAADCKPSPPAWPEPPVRWGVQDISGSTWTVDNEPQARYQGGITGRRLIRYVPEVVES
jgi:hypothetical protein